MKIGNLELSNWKRISSDDDFARTMLDGFGIMGFYWNFHGHNCWQPYAYGELDYYYKLYSKLNIPLTHDLDISKTNMDNFLLRYGKLYYLS